MVSLKRLAGILREPVLRETRANLARSRDRLAPHLHSDRQMLGRQGNGCGATIGAMPRCDFACRGCYLGDDANRIPAATVDEIKAQMRTLRPTLGNAGNLQLTDGEITLRPDAEVVELLRYARELGLVPMLMTHGDSFRRRPGLLERYMVEGGLSEVSIHVDTTQRGRKGAEWRAPNGEAALNPLRDEFAALVRRAKAETGLPLRCATTMTVTRDNLAGVADVMAWLRNNTDVFRLISFQPIAQVGRTEDGLGGGVPVDALWDEVARGLSMEPGRKGQLARGEQWLGHARCNRFVHGLVARREGALGAFLPVRMEGDGVGARVVDEFLARFGGVTFRRDSALEALARMLALAARAPGFLLRHVPPYLVHWARRFDPGHPVRAARDLLTGRLRIESLVIVSHHFMSSQELETPLGRERLSHCVFHVAIDGELVSMCEANAAGRRDAYYDRLRRRDPAAGDAAPAGDEMLSLS